MRIKAMKNKTNRKATKPAIQEDQNGSLEEQIALRAYELWRQRGSGHGSDLADWLQAQREILEEHQELPGEKANS